MVRVTSCMHTDGCPIDECDATPYKRHCKIVCPVHGVLFDCSDPFR
jgi:nitrite reductase/ring-hydroxylating ferredoxin subunit